jgi:hypothetical protein
MLSILRRAVRSWQKLRGAWVESALNLLERERPVAAD